MTGMVQVPFGNTTVTRIRPLAEPGAYQTYVRARPRPTHWRPGTCAEAKCEAWQHGWVTMLDDSVPGHAWMIDHCRHDKTRACTISHPGPHLWAFTYPPGTPCFRASQHLIPVLREPLFVVRDGDWRGNPTGNRRVLDVDDWTDHFRNHEDRLATARQKG